MKRKLITVDAETLLSTPMNKTMFIVDELIPQGVNVLSGASKIGKSWLMLWLGLQVSQGLPVWELPTKQCDVLYLCLEDTQRRIKDRLFELTDNPPRNFHLSVMCGLIGNGLEEEIINFLSDFPRLLTHSKRCGIPKAAPAKPECTATITMTSPPSNGSPTSTIFPLSLFIIFASSKTATIRSTRFRVLPESSVRQIPTMCSSANEAATPPPFLPAGGMWNIRS